MSQKSFLSYALGLSFENVLRLVLHTDPYYRSVDEPSLADNKNATEKKKERRGSDPAAAAAPQDKGTGFSTKMMRAVGAYWRATSAVQRAVHAGLAGYCLWLLLRRSHCIPCTVHIDSLSPSSAGGTTRVSARLSQFVSNACGGISRLMRGPGDDHRATAAPTYLYQSREGMQLLLRETPSALFSAWHALSGVLLVGLSLYQKESVPALRFVRRPSSSATMPPIKGGVSARIAETKKYRKRHQVCGMLTVATMASMTLTGIALRSISVYAAQPQPPEGDERPLKAVTAALDFGRMILWFAVPWGVFAPAIMISAKQRRALPHAIVGDLIFKASVSVPLARVLGAAYQHLAGIHVSLPAVPPGERQPLRVTQSLDGELECAYYAAIATAAALIGAWAAVDVCRVVGAAKREHTAVSRASTA